MSYKEELVSVIVPVYNVSEYLCRCLDSIVRQSYIYLEIIIVDDGSTDNSLKICNNYKNKDKRIKVYHKNNGGLSSARNFGLKKASGEYITFIDSDDFINKYYIEKLYKSIKDTNSDISCCFFKTFCKKIPLFEENNNDIKQSLFDRIEAINDMMYGNKINNSASCKLYKRKLFNDITYPLNIYFEDLATTYKVLQKAKRIILFEDELYYYYQRRTSILHQINEKKIEDLIHVINNMNYDLKENVLLEKSILARTINAHFYIYRNSNNKKIKELSKIFIKENRKRVLADKKITKKTRMGIIVSFISFNLVNYIFRAKEIINNKKK